VRILSFAAVVAVGLVPTAAVAQEKSATEEASCTDGRFSCDWFFKGFVGLGAVPHAPADDNKVSAVTTAEIGAFPLHGAFATGLSVSSASDWEGHWMVLTPGLFGQIDLTYVLLSGLYAYEPPPKFSFRLAIGSRIGLGISESFRPSDSNPTEKYAPSYMLLRPEMMTYLDLEVPIPGCRYYAIVGRGALDTAVNMSNLFRWSGAIGLRSAWGGP
jgi:hypothetical protein